MTNLHPNTLTRINTHLSTLFELPASTLAQTGTSLHLTDRRKADGWQFLWHLDHHVVAQIHPIHEIALQKVIAGKPADTRLSLTDITTQSPSAQTAIADYFYTVDEQSLIMPAIPDGYTIRQATQHDQSAFEDFLSACSEEDKAQGQVSLEDEALFVAFTADGTITAVASSFEFLGFVDIGVLTHPAHRKRGLGGACVAHISRHYLRQANDPRLLLYRHEVTNHGSRGVAVKVGYQNLAMVDYFKL
ncbi:MAG: GNAT family N-acetyltransferase [Chloroflexota bacterium]